MAAPGRGGPWSAVRAAVRRESERTSQRRVAEEIGIDHVTLHDFLEGAAPQARNAEKLLAWFRRLPPNRRGEPPELARTAAWINLEGLEGEVRRQVLADIAARISEGHAQQGTRPPEWVLWVREHGEPPADEDRESGGGEEDGDTDG